MSDRFESFQFENVIKLTQDTSSKTLRSFLCQKNASGAISSLRDQSTRKTIKGKLSKKRMDCGVDVRCQSGAMRMAIRTCWALYRSKAVGMRHCTRAVAPRLLDMVAASLNTLFLLAVCGRRLFPGARIVGGDKATFGKWPWQVRSTYFTCIMLVWYYCLSGIEVVYLFQ